MDPLMDPLMARVPGPRSGVSRDPLIGYLEVEGYPSMTPNGYLMGT